MEWFIMLKEEDQEFIRQFVISSGSLKQLAQIYEVSYPTVRLRLNNIINKLELLTQEEKNTFEIKIMQMVIDEKISLEIAKEIIKKYKEEQHD